MIDFDNRYYIHNSHKLANICIKNSTLLNWFTSCLRSNNLNFESHSVYNIDNCISRNKSIKHAYNTGNKPIAWVSNGSEIIFRKSGIDSRFLWAIPIHYLTRGRVFRPIRSTNICGNSLIDYLNSQLRNHQLHSLSNMCVSNDYIQKQNKNFDIDTNCGYEILSNYLGDYNESTGCYNDIKCCHRNLNNSHLNGGDKQIKCINYSVTSDDSCSSNYFVKFDNQTVCSDNFIKLLDNALYKAFNSDSSDTSHTNCDDFYTFKNVSPFANSGSSKTPSNTNTTDNSSTLEVTTIQHNRNVTANKVMYISVKNDPLDCEFAKWYNNNKIVSEWKRVRRGVYNVEGKLLNLALVNGRLFVKIMDNFTKKPFNMPIDDYTSKRSHKKL